MNDSRSAAILGFQIAFLTFATVLLTAPLDKYVVSRWEWARDWDLPLGRPLIFVVAVTLMIAIGPLRRRCIDLLSVPIAHGKRREVALGLLVNCVTTAGAMGAFALWHWAGGGEPALARSMGERFSDSVEMEKALSVSALVTFVFVAGSLGPIVEELVFRGMLYPAWKEAWGWLAGAFGSALVFGFFHGAVLPQFLAGLVFVGVLRRTGSLRAAIYTHALFNVLLWYPLLGRFAMPSGRSTGEIHLWTPHLVCLALTFVLLPWYLWSARNAATRDVR